MTEEILNIIKKENKALSINEINDLLGFNSVDQLKILIETINKMEDNLQVYRTKKDKYMLFTSNSVKIGKFLANRKSFGFVDADESKDIFIAPDNINGAIHGDRVIVEIISRKNEDPEGRVLKIVERKVKQIVGEFYYKKGVPYVAVDDDKLKMLIEIDKKRVGNVVNGHKVLVKILNRLQNGNYRGEIIKIIGHKNDPGVDILSVAYKYDINTEFNKKVLSEIEKIPNTVLKEEYNGRVDLRNDKIFTIDGDDVKDIDDALSIEKLESGNYKLGVHIADVSYYVKRNSAIDAEAYNRGTSVYLADRVIPMLPHKLSNGICSLNPNVDRLAISCVMEIDSTGKVVDYDIFESVIKSKKQMTYNNVNKILEENETIEDYRDYVNELQMMKELASILRNYKENRGYIDFDLNESKIIVNEAGEAIDVVVRNRGTSEKIIEDFMIAANETVATHIYFMGLPFIYRVHGKPDEEKINNFLKFISVLGYTVKGKIKEISSKTMQSILEQLKEKKEFHILSDLLLRSMKKAIYDKTNIGHFGLASQCYTHFTAPIRRYPDTTVHRLLRTYLFEKKVTKDVVDFYETHLIGLTEHASMKERNAIECEREVTDMKKAEYMMKHIGEEFEGIIVSVMNFGFFVQLPNLVEGLVRIEDLKDDYYMFDESTFSLVGTKNKRGYRLGDDVKVIVKNASKIMRTVDFVISDKK